MLITDKRLIAAKIIGCPPEDLLAFNEREDGSVAAIAPNGMKFTWSAWVLADYAYEDDRATNGPPYPPIEIPKPKPRPPAKPARRRIRKEK
jgi:hypothetical protein